MTSELRFEQTIKAEPAAVYHMFTNSTAMREWLADRALANPVPNGNLYLEWQSGYYIAGIFTHLQSPNQVAFSVQGRGEPGPTRVEVQIEPCQGGSLVTLVHSGLGEGEAWPAARKEIQKGWESAFKALVNALERGPDLRITTRPMLGVMFGEFTPEIAHALGVPVHEGMLLSGTIEGLGAQKAGMQKDDVVVALDGSPIANYNDLHNAVQGKQAGDAITITYYRGAEKREAHLVLSPRPLPDIPTTVAGLAEALKQVYHREQAELESVLKGVTEEEASFKPAEKEWNIKEVLAHLIHVERGNQNMITELFLSHQSIADGFGDNLDAAVKATAAAYGSAQALEDAFHTSREETVRLVANLPKSFEQRKSTLWQMGHQLLAYPFHVHEHADQIKATIEQARKAAKS